MKKFLCGLMMFVVFLLVGCDKKSDELDLSGSSKVQEQLSKYSQSEAYGEIIHHGEMANDVVIKNMKFQDNLYGLGIGLKAKSGNTAITLLCDIRSNQAVLTHTIKNDENYIPKGNMEISIMQYRPGVTDIREADDSQEPLFSTANGDTDLLESLLKVGSLPKETILAFVIDKEDAEGNYNGIAWSPLFTVEQFLRALPETKSKCMGLKLDLDSEHLVAAEKG